jgi:hypothetical protein
VTYGIGFSPVGRGVGAFLGAYAALLLVWTGRGNDWLRAGARAFTTLLLATSWLFPWHPSY